MIQHRFGTSASTTRVVWVDMRNGDQISVPGDFRPEEWLTQMPYWTPRYLFRLRSRR
jgi:hypothetical protein